MEISMTNTRPNLKFMTRANSRIPRKRPSRAFWIKALTEFSESGLSVQAFCRLHHLSPSSFYAWRKRLRVEEADTPLDPTTFIPLEVIENDHLLDSSKETTKNPHSPPPSAMERSEYNSGLTLHVNNDLKISIDKGFHKASFMRLISLLSSQEI